MASVSIFRADEVGELLLCWEFSFEFSWEFRLEFVGGHANGIGLGAEGILDFDVIFLGTEDDSD
jgi:hypothetical protein